MEEKVVICAIAGVLFIFGFLCDCTWTVVFYIGLVRFVLWLISAASGAKRYFLSKTNEPKIGKMLALCLCLTTLSI